jgi:hypothetical protein
MGFPIKAPQTQDSEHGRRVQVEGDVSLGDATLVVEGFVAVQPLLL